ncbi:MAG: UrcA family protein [Sphingobium sp.]
MFAFPIHAKAFTVALISAAALIPGTSAFAEPFVSNGRTAEVRFADLDLTNAKDRTELQSRLRRAATRVCVNSNTREMMACRQKALAHIEAPVSAALARAETRARYADARTGAKVMVGN